MPGLIGTWRWGASQAGAFGSSGLCHLRQTPMPVPVKAEPISAATRPRAAFLDPFGAARPGFNMNLSLGYTQTPVATLVSQPAPASAAVNRFYRPELDLLRLVAFISVFLTHGPRLVDSAVPWRHALATSYNRVAASGVFGLCLFFFLSSCLITELLGREQRQTGSIHLRWFYVRRVLRIWPLY